jgi:hypothetical protein
MACIFLLLGIVGKRMSCFQNYFKAKLKIIRSMCQKNGIIECKYAKEHLEVNILWQKIQQWWGLKINYG